MSWSDPNRGWEPADESLVCTCGQVGCTGGVVCDCGGCVESVVNWGEDC